MPFNCFRKKKPSKEPKVKPPSLAQIDRRLTPPRPDLLGDDDIDTKQQKNGYINPPPLPHRQNGSSNNRYTPGLIGDQAPHGPYQDIKHTNDSSPDSTSKRRISAHPVKQLSSDLLSTRVPINGGCSSSPPPDSPESYQRQRIDSDDYLDPANSSMVSPTPSSTQSESGKTKASLSEEKRSEIFNDYFPQSHSVSSPTDALAIKVPFQLSSGGSEPAHDYTNIMEYPDTFSPMAPNKDKAHFEIPQTSPRSVTDLSKLTTDSGESTLRSPYRRPKPVPRQATSGNSSRKQSLTSETDDLTFTYDYENVPDIELPPAHSTGSKSAPPKPQPRIRGSPDNSMSPNQINISVPAPANLKLSPLQARTQHEAYISEPEYVQPSLSSGSSSEKNSPNHSPGGTLPRHNSPETGASSGQDSAAVDLSARIPKADLLEVGQAGQKKQGYLPMDKSLQTIIANRKLMNASPETAKHRDLNMKVPVPKASNTHAPGYITVLGGISKPPAPKKSGTYYNLTTDQSNYNNPDTWTKVTVPQKNHHHHLKGNETSYFG